MSGASNAEYRRAEDARRLVLTLHTAIVRLGSSGIQSWLDPKKYQEIDIEVKQLLPYLKAVACMFLM